MTKKCICVVDSRGRVTLPRELRIKVGVRPGDRVQFVEKGKTLTIRPLPRQSHPGSPFAKYIGVLPAFRSAKEVNEWLRDLRGR